MYKILNRYVIYLKLIFKVNYTSIIFLISKKDSIVKSNKYLPYICFPAKFFSLKAIAVFHFLYVTIYNLSVFKNLNIFFLHYCFGFGFFACFTQMIHTALCLGVVVLVVSFHNRR